MIERDEIETEWPAAGDEVNAALVPLVELVLALTTDGSLERKAALSEVLASAGRIRAALASKPRLN
jgi:hypothetical protein